MNTASEKVVPNGWRKLSTQTGRINGHFSLIDHTFNHDHVLLPKRRDTLTSGVQLYNSLWISGKLPTPPLIAVFLVFEILWMGPQVNLIQFMCKIILTHKWQIKLTHKLCICYKPLALSSSIRCYAFLFLLYLLHIYDPIFYLYFTLFQAHFSEVKTIEI